MIKKIKEKLYWRGVEPKDLVMISLCFLVLFSAIAISIVAIVVS